MSKKEINPKSKIANPTLSLCMIVKNEEKSLPVCLDSVKDHVDEIIIVDTGSTDRTVEIAKGYNAKVYHHSWENSFSKARNYSLKYAKCDWILILDADEEVDKKDAYKLREVIRDKNLNTIRLPVYSKLDEGRNLAVGNSERIFRNHLGIHYEGIVHNKLKTKVPTKAFDIKVHHHGYSHDKEQMEKKFIRTTTLLKEQIKENPEDPVPHHYLATSYLDNKGKNDECLQEALEAARLYELQNSKEQTRLLNYYTASIAFLRKNDLGNAEKFALKSLDFYPEYLDGYCLLSTIYFDLKEYGKCIEYTNKYLKMLKSIDSDPTSVLSIPYNTLQQSWMAYSKFAVIYYEQNNKDKGDEALRNALNSTEWKWTPYYFVGRHFFEQNNFKMAEVFFKDGLKNEPHNKMLLYNIVETCERLGILDKAINYLKKILEVYPDQVSAYYRLGLLQMKKNQFDKAIDSFKSLINKDPRHIGALFNLGNAYERMGSIHSDKAHYIRARECIVNVLKLEKNSIEPYLLLSKICLYLNDLDACTKCCGEILRILNLPGNILIKNKSDLSSLYVGIGKALIKEQKKALADVSFEIAGLLDPELSQEGV